jgi:Tol biopolymer transport system component
VRSANDSASSIVGDSADTGPSVDYRPRVSPNGAQVVFVCYWQFYLNICRADADGSGLVNLTAGAFSTDMSPDWSPASDSIVFVRNNQVWVMAADGANAHQIPSSPTVYSVAWAPLAGSRRIAYITTPFPGQVRTRDLDSAGTTDSLVFAGSTYASDLRSVDWSPGADSVAFSVRVNGYFATYLAPRGGGPAVRVANVPGPSFSPDTRPAWTDQGVFVTAAPAYPSPQRNRLFLHRSNGTMVRVGRDPTGTFGPGMDKQ